MIKYSYIKKILEKEDKDEVISVLKQKLEPIDFPYKVSFSKYSKEEIVDHILKFIPVLKSQKYNITNVKNISGQFYKNFWFNFRGKFLYVPSEKDQYDKINIFGDYYNEDARIKSIGFGETMSPYEFWKNEKERIIKVLLDRKEDITLETLRENIYQNIKEARSGKITTYLTYFSYFQPISILDPSSAWGERLISAMFSPSVKFYFGTDPNNELKEGYDNIRKDLFSLIPKEFNKKKDNFVTKISAFEDIKLPMDEYYDLVIISPPPFIGEVYSGKQGKQASVNYNTFEAYVIVFLVPYFAKAASRIVDGGYMIASFLDRKKTSFSDEYNVTELILMLIEIFCENIHYNGVISWQGDSGSLTPYWIFRKKKYDRNRQMLKITRNLRIIKENYPSNIYARVENFKTTFFDVSPISPGKIMIKDNEYTIAKLTHVVKQADETTNRLLIKELKNSGYEDFFKNFDFYNSKNLKNNLLEVIYDLSLALWRNSKE